MQSNSEKDLGLAQIHSSESGLQKVVNRLISNLERDALVQQTTTRLRDTLQVDRVVLYYFYRPWKGQVTFEAVRSPQFSILGSTGPDDCFNGEYATLYAAGRFRAISDIEKEPIQPCHRDFLRGLQVYANLVVPVLTQRGLWGLLVAHDCQAPRYWVPSDVDVMQKGAKALESAPCIRDGV